MKYLSELNQLLESSNIINHQHAAICVLGGKIISYGYNISTNPHLIKVGKNKYRFREIYTC